MTNIDASMLDFRQLNAAIRDCTGDAAVTGCSGQRILRRSITIAYPVGNPGKRPGRLFKRSQH